VVTDDGEGVSVSVETGRWSISMRITFHSASVSGPGLLRMDSGTPIFPMSWRLPPMRSPSISGTESPSVLPRRTARRAVRSVWPWV
jgi:hypothetical protein